MVPEVRNLGVRSISIYLEGVDTKRELNYSISLDRLNHIQDQFVQYSGHPAPVIPGKISLPVLIPKELPSETYKFDYMIFYNPQFNGDDVNLSGVDFNHVSDNPDTTIPQIIEEDIQLTAIEGLNSEGGHISIRAQIPVEGVDSGNRVTESFRIRMPNGKVEYVSGDYDNGYIIGELENPIIWKESICFPT